MKSKKKIIVACGTGIATSTAVKSKIYDYLKEKGMNVEIDQCKISELKSQIENTKADLVVTTGPVGGNYNLPVVNGVSFLTGINEEKTLNEIISYLKT
ncbi:PTS sugar transporter subunit IIB [Halanaerobium sp. Z-7514]|uniref:PTS sugar transporter subunit IIB n=1 Tax=Halanaerobium polyolivorans TaxID=2886943 RepID=A0AAW4X1F4_9FIRM|nr:PTS sugar transporter subunit IIB [Halanaerobium polyolivorans]MCC3145598.1 PTS sugar transporter subunit IIB [Halanaerobium polyolivorans]